MNHVYKMALSRRFRLTVCSVFTFEVVSTLRFSYSFFSEESFQRLSFIPRKFFRFHYLLRFYSCFGDSPILLSLLWCVRFSWLFSVCEVFLVYFPKVVRVLSKSGFEDISDPKQETHNNPIQKLHLSLVWWVRRESAICP